MKLLAPLLLTLLALPVVATQPVQFLQAEDFRAHDPLTGDADRLQEKEICRMYRKAFPDLKPAILASYAAGDVCVQHWRMTGTHQGELLGLAPMGARCTVEGITVDRFKGGRIVESWTQWDALGLMRQLGVAQPLGAGAVKAEAERRGLPHAKDTVAALPIWEQASAKAVFSKPGILSEGELESRIHIRHEQYQKAIAIETQVLREMAETQILPSITADLGARAESLGKLAVAGIAGASFTWSRQWNEQQRTQLVDPGRGRLQITLLGLIN